MLLSHLWVGAVAICEVVFHDVDASQAEVVFEQMQTVFSFGDGVFWDSGVQSLIQISKDSQEIPA